jgi:fimbrial chaperone protein
MNGSMRTFVRFVILAGVCWLAVPFLTSYQAAAAGFQVSPITLALGQGIRSGVFTVTNQDQQKMNFQISISEWTQNAEGKDEYSETADIVFFPKIMTVEAGEQRVIRVGVKGPPPLQEKTYRIFIEQIPTHGKAKGVNIAIYFRFAPPIFVKPAMVTVSGTIDGIELTPGKVKAVVKNTGNVHFRISSILVKGIAANGSEVFSKEIEGWYLLNRATRILEAQFPKEKCRDLSSIEIEAKTENFNLNGNLHVQKGMCGQ